MITLRKTLLLLAAAVAAGCGTLRPATPVSDKTDFYAHRGGRAENDENTLQAFRQCIAIGCNRFETDVRMSADGVIVISHDANLKRRTGFDGRIEEMTGRDILAKKTFLGHGIPRLEDVLRLFKKEKVAYAEWEMKTSNRQEYPDERIPVYCEALYAAVSKAQPEGTLWVFTSFDERPLRYIKEHHPEARTGLITDKPVCSATIEAAKAIGASQLDAGVNGTTREAVEAAHKAGLEVCLWPGYDTAGYRRMKELGADRCCTDAPNLLSVELR